MAFTPFSTPEPAPPAETKPAETVTPDQPAKTKPAAPKKNKRTKTK